MARLTHAVTGVHVTLDDEKVERLGKEWVAEKPAPKPSRKGKSDE